MKYRAYENYVDSGLQWMGSIPSHWKVMQSRRLFAQRKERARPEDEQLTASQKYGVIYQKLYMEIENQRVVQVITGSDILKHVEANDFVISMRSFQGGLEWCKYPGSVSSAYVGLIPIKHVVPEFFAYLFKCSPYIQALQSTSNLVRDGQALRFENFSQVDLPYIPEDEQRLIASFLDHETAKIDILIEKQQQLIKLLKEKRQAVISHAVTKGLNPNAPMRDSNVEWLGEVPAHWEVKSIKHLCSLIKDGTHLPPPRVDAGIPLLSVRNIIDEKFVFRDDDSNISEKDYETLCKSFIPKTGDVLLAIVGATLGKVAVVEEMFKFHIQRSVAIFRSRPELIVSETLANIFGSTNFQSILWENVGFSAQPGIYLGTLENFKLPIPPLDEQIEINEFCRTKKMQIDFLTEKADKAIKLMYERRTALISAAVTGKIDVRNWQAPSHTTNQKIAA